MINNNSPPRFDKIWFKNKRMGCYDRIAGRNVDNQKNCFS